MDGRGGVPQEGWEASVVEFEAGELREGGEGQEPSHPSGNRDAPPGAGQMLPRYCSYDQCDSALSLGLAGESPSVI